MDEPPERPGDGTIRRCGAGDFDEILSIVNAAAEAYRGEIPDDLWSEPYMPADELEEEIEAGVRFFGWAEEGRVQGVMGVQDRGDVTLIRHAYVRPLAQGRGIGSRLMEHLLAEAGGTFLVGTWSAATWALRFYRGHGFRPVSEERARRLLERYWSVPEEQAWASVVLARGRTPGSPEPWSGPGVGK